MKTYVKNAKSPDAHITVVVLL